MFWGFSKALTFSLSLTHTDTFPFLPSVFDCSDWCHVLKASAWSALYLYKHPFIESALFSVCSARFSSLRCRCVLRAFASCLEELRLLTPALVPYGPLYKVRNCQQTNWQQSPPTAAGEREHLKKREKNVYVWAGGQNERWTEMEDELEGEKIGLLLTLRNPPALRSGLWEVLPSFSEISQPRGGRLEQTGGIACRPSIAATWAETGKSGCLIQGNNWSNSKCWRETRQVRPHQTSFKRCHMSRFVLHYSLCYCEKTCWR